MRYLNALILTAGIGAAASLYAPGAEAGVYVGIGVPAPVVVAPAAAVAPATVLAPRLVVGVPAAAPYYYAPPVWLAAGYFGARWGYGHVYAHRYYGGRR